MIWLAILAASPWAPPVAIRPLMTPELVIARAAACGLPPVRVRLREDDLLQEEVISIARGPALSDDQRHCLAKVSIEAVRYVQFDDASEQQPYERLYWQMAETETQSQARERLRTAGLLDKLPVYDSSKQSLRAYGAALEQLCGATPGSLFDEQTGISLGAASTPKLGETYLCLLDAIRASNLREQGVRFGFIGKEAAIAPSEGQSESPH